MMCCEVVVDRNSIFGHVTTTLVVLQSHFEYPKGALGSSEMNYFPKNHEKVDFFFFSQKRFALAWDLEKYHWMCRPKCIL